ncbi:hypothetical protein F5B19DRAFT_478770 [Rostrohypoxylon terebratum]|nr:hypothetical protein F5B19DRAFT_478770 [Rostrohypoxylon terebratum]
MANNNFKIKPLPSGAVAKVPPVALWLQTSAANFQLVDNIKICKNIEGLADKTTDLLKYFAAEVTFPVSQNRITAIHFDEPAVVPVEEGWTVDLIPVHLVGGVMKVEDEVLNPEFYVHLTKKAQVSGDFFAVLLLSQIGI